MCNGIICTALSSVHQHISKPLACEHSEIVLTAICAKKNENFCPCAGTLQNCIFIFQSFCNEITSTLKNSVTGLYNDKIGSAGEFWFQA
jgi:hypothetical protein